MPSPAGYSGTPLAKKLGIVENTQVTTMRAPVHYLQWLAPIPAGVVFQAETTSSTRVVHLFTAGKAELQSDLARLRTAIRPDAAVWVSWPKKASRVPTDITEDTIREIAIPLGFVDVKVCAVNEVWSGLKLVIRKTLR
jgi:hypothetical protein